MAWISEPGLQLLQLFCTTKSTEKKDFTSAHKLVGHHFGGVIQKNTFTLLLCSEAKLFGNNLRVSPVHAWDEPLLYLGFVTWNEDMLETNTTPHFPLVDQSRGPITGMEAFNRSKSHFKSVNTASELASKADGDLLETIVHASLTLASMKMHNGIIAGVDSLEYITLARNVMMPGNFVQQPVPQFLTDLPFPRFKMPALGGSTLDYLPV